MSMLNLIKDVQADLRAASTLSYVRDADIFITADENLIPVNAKFPAIGLKDGNENRERDPVQVPADRWQEGFYQVHAIMYVEMSEGETPLIGQTSPTVIKGILEMEADIDAVLIAGFEAMTGVEDFNIIDSPESEVVGGNDMLLLKKRRTYQYSIIEET